MNRYNHRLRDSKQRYKEFINSMKEWSLGFVVLLFLPGELFINKVFIFFSHPENFI